MTISAVLARVRALGECHSDDWLSITRGDRDDLLAHVETLTAERDAAREYGVQARIRENKAEDARVHMRLELSKVEVERDAARAQAEALAGALGPFAEEAGTFLDAAKDTDLVWCGIEGDDDSGNASGNVCVRDYRYARRILAAYKSAYQSERVSPVADARLASALSRDHLPEGDCR